MQDNEGAFPIESNYSAQFHAGLTKREWFAGMALIGFVGAYNCSDESIDESVKKAAKLAYKLADSMLKEAPNDTKS